MDETRFVDLRDADTRGEAPQASARRAAGDRSASDPAAATDGGNPTSDTRVTTRLSGVPVIGPMLALLTVLARRGWHVVGALALIVWRVVRLPAVVARRRPALAVTVLFALALLAFVLARGGA